MHTLNHNGVEVEYHGTKKKIWHATYKTHAVSGTPAGYYINKAFTPGPGDPLTNLQRGLQKVDNDDELRSSVA